MWDPYEDSWEIGTCDGGSYVCERSHVEHGKCGAHQRWIRVSLGSPWMLMWWYNFLSSMYSPFFIIWILYSLSLSTLFISLINFYHFSYFLSLVYIILCILRKIERVEGDRGNVEEEDLNLFLMENVFKHELFILRIQTRLRVLKNFLVIVTKLA